MSGVIESGTCCIKRQLHQAHLACARVLELFWNVYLLRLRPRQQESEKRATTPVDKVERV